MNDSTVAGNVIYVQGMAGCERGYSVDVILTWAESGGEILRTQEVSAKRIAGIVQTLS
jgi:hypothetical protein